MKSTIPNIIRKIVSLAEPDWPVVKPSTGFEPNMIFLLTPPNSGSTAISNVFTNSTNVSAMQCRAEGQWLIKGLCSSDRWNTNKQLDERSIRSVWVNACYEKHKSAGASYFIEKSPPNMMRIEVLQSLFPRHIIFANNRNPYAQISSRLHRYTKSGDKISTKDREDKLFAYAEDWKNRGEILKRIIQMQKIPYLSYENFCKKPILLQDVINQSIFNGQIILDFEKKLKVKDYEIGPIANYNERQIKKLNDQDIELITNSLKQRSDLLSYFGYELIN